MKSVVDAWQKKKDGGGAVRDLDASSAVPAPPFDGERCSARFSELDRSDRLATLGRMFRYMTTITLVLVLVNGRWLAAWLDVPLLATIVFLYSTVLMSTYIHVDLGPATGDACRGILSEPTMRKAILSLHVALLPMAFLTHPGAYGLRLVPALGTAVLAAAYMAVVQPYKGVYLTRPLRLPSPAPGSSCFHSVTLTHSRACAWTTNSVVFLLSVVLCALFSERKVP